MKGQAILGGPVPRALENEISEIGETRTPPITGENLETEANLYHTVNLFLTRNIMNKNFDL